MSDIVIFIRILMISFCVVFQKAVGGRLFLGDADGLMSELLKTSIPKPLTLGLNYWDEAGSSGSICLGLAAQLGRILIIF